MKKLFKWLLFLTGTLGIVLAVLVYNPGWIKAPLARYLSNASGYSVSLDGKLGLNPGRVFSMTANDIHVTAPGGAGKRDMLAVAHLRLDLVTRSLFEDSVIFKALQVDGLQLNLESSADGVKNWARPVAPAADDSGQNKGKPRVFFQNIQVNNTSLRYLNGEKGVEHVLHIASLEQSRQADGMLQVSMDGGFNNRPVKFEAALGPYINLLDGRNVRYTVNGHFGKLDIRGKGLIDELTGPKRPDFTLKMQGPDIDEITSMFSTDDLGNGAFLLHARGGEVDGSYTVDLNGDIGDITLAASAKLPSLAELDGVKLGFSANGSNLGSFMRTLGVKGWPDKPFSLKGEVERTGDALNVSDLSLAIGGTELTLDARLTNFPDLDGSQVRLSVSGDDVAQFRELLGISGVATGPFTLRGSLDVSPQEVELLQLEVTTALGQASVSGTLGKGPAYQGSKLHVNLTGPDAHLLASVFGIDALPSRSFSLDTQVEIVQNGLHFERGVLVTIDDERLELGGLITFNAGGVGSDLEARISGGHPGQMLRRLAGDIHLPDTPYVLDGRVRIQQGGIQLDDVKATYAGIKLAVTGLIKPSDQLSGSGLDFEVSGNDLSSLSQFPDIADSLQVIVPGLPYQASGRFTVDNEGWRFSGVSGKVGATQLGFDALASRQPGWVGSKLQFSLKGPDLHGLILAEDDSRLPAGAFSTSANVLLSNDTLSINGLRFNTTGAHGEMELDFGWPFSTATDAGFDINVQGDDIRHLLPKAEAFEPQEAAYKIRALGRKQGSLLSLQQLDMSFGNLSIALQGKLDDNPADEHVNMSLRVHSADLSALGLLNGEPLPPVPLDIQANVGGSTQHFVFKNLVVMLAESQVAGTLDVSLQGQRPEVILTATSSHLDLRPLLGGDEPDDTPATDKVEERLIPAIPLPLDALAAADMNIKLNIAQLQHGNDSIRNLAFQASTDDGRLSVPVLSFEGARGKLVSSLSLEPDDSGKARVRVDLTTDKLAFNFKGLPKEELDQVSLIDIDFQATGRGANLRELAGSADGALFIGTEGGKLEGVDLSLLDTFVLEELFRLIMPKSDTKGDTELTCAATTLKIADGLVTTDPALAFTTDRITVISKGTLDLKTEAIKFNFNATPNNALNLSAGELFNPYILVSGTLSKPEVGLDPGKVLLHGGVAIGTAGISILAKGVYDRVNSNSPLCEDMLKKAQQRP